MTLDQVLSVYLFKSGYLAAVVISVMTIGACIIKSLVFRRLMKRFESTQFWWQYAFFAAVSIPLTLLILAFGVSWLVQLNAEHLGFSEMGVEVVRQSFILIFATWSVFRFAGIAGERYILTYPDADRALVFAMSQVTRLVIILLAVLVIMEMYQIPVSGVLAFGGVGAAAIAFASKDLLGNFFGGLMIYLDQPFKVGDWIRSPDKSIEGTVEFIGWRLTRIRTFEKRPLYVPNGIFSNIIVENPSRMFKRRIDVTIGLRYDDADKLKAVIADLRELIETHECVDKKEQHYVFFNQFASSSLNILVRAHTNTTVYRRFLEIQEEIFFKILEIIDKHGAECAFPTTTVHIPNEIQSKAVS